MAGSVNKVILIGNLGRDPEARSLQNGTKIVQFSVATSETWKDRNSGERRERTEWTNVVIWNEHLAEIAEKYLKKGSKVYIEGALQTRKYGEDRYVTEVVLQKYKGELQILDSGRESQGGQAQGRPQFSQPQDSSFRGGGSQHERHAAGSGRSVDLDDEIPF